MVQRCAICKNSTEKSLKLFHAPKDPHRRKAWSDACGFDLNVKSAVCNLHFGEMDFCFYGKGTLKSKLKLSALPKNPRLEKLDSLTQIKPEPEFVPVNAEVTTKTFETNFVIKEEPIDSQSLSFINEERADVYPDDPIQTLDLKHDLTTCENGVSLLNEVAVKTLSCGHIVMETTSDGIQTYKLICDHCQTTFSTKNENFWSNFVKHINEAHIPEPRINTETDSKQQTVEAAAASAEAEIQTAAKENVVETNKDTNQSKNLEQTTPELKNEPNGGENKSDDHSFNDNDLQDFSDSDWEDETFEPKRKKHKRIKAVKQKSSNEVETPQTNVDILSFDHPNRNCVITFLELLTTRAILWLPRQSIMKRFDEALGELTSKFIEFFPRYALTKDQMRQSIKNIKDLYQRLSESEKVDSKTKRRLKISEYKTKFPEYFELCAEIEENSKNILQSCDICKTTFYSPQDLQVHKFKKHRIGELPYKCQRCCYGFACPEKLASHEEKHNRTKRFKCEICGQGFYFESKLQAHMALHTDDSKQICEICGKKFPSLSKYRRHKLHHEAPKEKCEICGKLYFEKWTLSEHLKSHKNERQYRCDICGKTFNRQEGVTIHKRGVHKIKTQTKKYVWVNRVTSSMSNAETASGYQYEEDESMTNEEFISLVGSGGNAGEKSADMQNTNSNSTSFSSAPNDETISNQINIDVKPTISNTNQQNIFPLEILTSLLN